MAQRPSLSPMDISWALCWIADLRNRLWRLPVSGVRAARATTSRVPTITVARVDRVTAVVQRAHLTGPG